MPELCSNIWLGQAATAGIPGEMSTKGIRKMGATPFTAWTGCSLDR